MNQGISESLLSQLSEIITVHVGLHFPRERWHDLERGISGAAKEFGFDAIGSCIKWLLSSPLTRNQIEILASNLTVGETYFFRDKRIFEILEEHIIPELVCSLGTSDRRLRIWSAGCATGEEPYSIAIMLKKMIPNLRDWNITILATDINPRFLQKASKGIYTDWSFRDTPQWIKDGFFETKEDNLFQISSDIKEMVTFSYLNLGEDSYPSLLNNTNAVNIIFCRNVLMYFAVDKMNSVIQKLYRSLVDGGWLIVSPCETSKTLSSQFVTANFPGTAIYRKDLKSLQTIEGPFLKEMQPQGEYDKTRMLFQTSYGPPEMPSPETIVTQTTLILDKKLEDQAVSIPMNLYEKAMDLYRQGIYQEAVEKLIILLSRNKEAENNTTLIQKEAIDLLIRAYANYGKFDEAREWCEKAIEMDKMNPGFHYLRATILQEQGHIEESVKSLKRALYLDSNFTLAHFALGILSRKKGKLKESGKHLENALSTLNTFKEEDIIPESEGITARRLKDIIVSTMGEIP